MQERDFIQFFQRAMKPLKDRVFLMAGKALIAAVNDANGIQETQIKVLKGESMERVPRIQNFGFSSNPPAGSEAIVLALGGNRENLIVIACENREVRVKQLESGESVVYTDDGSYILLKKGGEIEVKAATKVTLDVPLSVLKGDVEIEGTLLVKDDATFEKKIDATLDITSSANVVGGTTSLLAIKTAYNGHGHAPTPVSPPAPLIP